MPDTETDHTRLHELVARALDDRAHALTTADEGLLRSLLHDEFCYTNASGHRLDADGYVALTITGALRWKRQQTRVRSLIRVGDVGVITADITDEVVMDGTLHSWEFASTQVYEIDVDGFLPRGPHRPSGRHLARVAGPVMHEQGPGPGTRGLGTRARGGS